MAVAEQISGILNARSRGRYREVLAILMRYGVSEVLENLAHGRISPRVSAQAVRDALCELGPAFIKLGQLLSTREELLSKPFRDELAKLQDEATPFPFAVVRDVIEQELGTPVASLFERIEAKPIATGSIGQVHRAWLPDGTEVAVKVQRPALEDLLDCDIAIIRQLIFRVADSPAKGDSVARLVSDFFSDVQSELNFEFEADNLDRFAWQFEADPSIRVPRVIRSHSARHVLTTSYEAGTRLADISGSTAQGRTVAQDLAKTLLRQIFCFGFFHGDPHADNVIVTSIGALGFYDLGLVGEFCVREREAMSALFLALLEQDPDAATSSLCRLAGPDVPSDRAALYQDLQHFIADHRPTLASSVTRLLADILQLTAKHHLVLPKGFYLAFKVLATADSVGRTLDPGFDLVKIALPLLRRNHSASPPQKMEGTRLFETGIDAMWRFQDLSVALRTTFTQLSQGQLKLQFEHRGLEDAARCYDRASSRLASVLFLAFLSLGGFGVICCCILARLVTVRQAIVASFVLTLFSGSLVLLLNRLTAYSGPWKRMRDR